MLSGCVPILHMFIMQGYEGVEQFPLMHIALMGLCYLAGTSFYVTHWPEKRWPATFDIWVSEIASSVLDFSYDTNSTFSAGSKPSIVPCVYRPWPICIPTGAQECFARGLYVKGRPRNSSSNTQ